MIRPRRAVASSNAGARLATCCENEAATAALEATWLIHISAPATKPTNGPNATDR